MISVAIGETSVKRSSCTSIIHSEIFLLFFLFFERYFLNYMLAKDFLFRSWGLRISWHPWDIWNLKKSDLLVFRSLNLQIYPELLKFWFLRTKSWNFAHIEFFLFTFVGSFKPQNFAFSKLGILRASNPWISEL